MQARLRFFLRTLAITVTAALVAAPSVTFAQNDKVQADFKGAIGLGLVGAELGGVIPALVGVDADTTWAYIVFPAVGAAGGAIGGYFALDKPDRVELSIAALTLGMALVIPAFVITLSATAYDSGDVDNRSARGSPASQARMDKARAIAARQAQSRGWQRLRALAASGPGLMRVVDGEFALAAPGLDVLPAMRVNGAMQVAGVSVSLLSGRF